MALSHGLHLLFSKSMTPRLLAILKYFDLQYEEQKVDPFVYARTHFYSLFPYMRLLPWQYALLSERIHIPRLCDKVSNEYF